MNTAPVKIKAILKELRGRHGPKRVDLRSYISVGSEAWNAYVGKFGIPGYKVRRRKMISRLDRLIRDWNIPSEISTDTQVQVSAELARSTQRRREVSQPLSFSSVSQIGTDIPYLRTLTSEGLLKAKQFLAELRSDSQRAPFPPKELLYHPRYSRSFHKKFTLQDRQFRTRKDVGMYLSSVLRPIQGNVVDEAAFWSWIGMFYFRRSISYSGGVARFSARDEAFIMDSDGDRSVQRRYRHQLWGAWRLYEQHGEIADFLLNEPIYSWSDMAQRVFGSSRVFNSTGIVALISRIYTLDGKQKRGCLKSKGGVRHLLRVLRQLELTYDVYAMSPDSLLKVLPQAFRDWDS